MDIDALMALAQDKNAAEIVWTPMGGHIIFLPRGFREKLPKKRRSTNYKGRVGENNVFITIGEYPDGRPGEVFIDIAREGESLRSFAAILARFITKCLQFGISVEEVCDTLIGTKFPPSGLYESPIDGITEATSIPDLVGKLLRKLYVEEK